MNGISRSALAFVFFTFSLTSCTNDRVSDNATACPIRIAALPKPDGEGTIEKLLSQQEAMNLLAKTQIIVGRPIDPTYINNTRAIVRRQDGVRKTILLPFGMNAGIGDRVAFQTGYLSPTPLCSYVPALATAKLAPN